MIKKVLKLFIIFLMSTNVYASSTGGARIGNNFYDSLLDAIKEVGPNEIITLGTDFKTDLPIEINKTVRINLNGHDIEAREKVFKIQGGSLELTGKGTVRELEPNYAPIFIKGSTNENDTNYSTVTIGEDVTLEGWSGVFIDHDLNSSYGVLVNVFGDINSLLDTNGGTGHGVYINGNIKQASNCPTIEIHEKSNITSLGNGIYMAGCSNVILNGGSVSGKEAGIAIKSGLLKVLSGSISSNGEDKTPSGGNNNGTNPSGTALQIESNSGYSGDMEIFINSGSLTSQNSYVLYEYIASGRDTEVSDISITGGTFITNSNKDVFNLSGAFKTKFPSFISGGTYKTNPSSYLKSGYEVVSDNSLYEVVSSTMNEVNYLNIEKGNSSLVLILSIIAILILAVVSYLNREKILNLFKR